MKLLQLLPIGKLDDNLLRGLQGGIPQFVDVLCEVLPPVPDPAPALHSERQQYHSSEILRRMQDLVTRRTWRLLGVTSLDLYIPILTFVFGEAQMGGPCALVSTYRLRQEFYGLQPDFELLQQRLLKEAVHELGHTLDLKHCHDYECVMASAHAVEWIDLRRPALCEACRTQMMSSVSEV
ncbi:MAG TPA: archaemetzincin family Zn-dependent metalloprotease [Terriglobales bacterium]|nr:archaemetzincin family Zn-dependent metalloprotease [Terriglobales bacterium]